MKLGYKRRQKHVRNLHLYRVNKKNGRVYWRLRIPSPEGSGFRERQFASEAEALTAFEVAYIAHQNHGTSAAHLGARERGDAICALETLRPFGVSLSEAARFYHLHHINLGESKPVQDVVAELLRAKKQDGLSSRYLEDLSSRLGRFVQSFGTRKIAEITVDEIESWLRELSVGR